MATQQGGGERRVEREGGGGAEPACSTHTSCRTLQKVRECPISLFTEEKEKVDDMQHMLTELQELAPRSCY